MDTKGVKPRTRPAPSQPSPAEVLAAFDEAFQASPKAGSRAFDVAGFELGMTPEQALTVCNANGRNHTRIFSVIDGVGEPRTTMPLADPVPVGSELEKRFYGVRTPYLVGPYQSTLFCTWKVGSAEISFGPPPANAVRAVRLSTKVLPIGMAVVKARLLSHYGPIAEEVQPENTQRLRPDDGLTASSLKWPNAGVGRDCAPQIRTRSSASSESIFTPILPLGAETDTCQTQLIVRVTGRGESIAEFTLGNLSTSLDEGDRFREALRRANPSIKPRPSARATNTESAELACKALMHVGCVESSLPGCAERLEFLNRTRHIMLDPKTKLPLPSERTLYQCLIVASTVEQARACGVSCDAKPDAQRASSSSGMPAYANEFFTASCQRMSRVGCGGGKLADCAVALQSQNNGTMNADCVESAQSALDVLYCGARCGDAVAVASQLTQSFSDACSNLRRHKCRVGFSKTCESDLQRAVPFLRQTRPNPHECLATANNPLDFVRCGLPCIPPSSDERE